MLPNFLSMARIAVIPPLVILLFLPGDPARQFAFALYVLACVTDYLDGVLARRMNQSSRLGAFLDPIADKLLVGAVLMMLVITERVTGLNALACVIILLREIMVSGLREFLAGVKIGLPVRPLGKWKTAAQMIALGILIVENALIPPPFPMREIGLVLLWAAAALTLLSGYHYLRAGLQHIRDNP